MDARARIDARVLRARRGAAHPEGSDRPAEDGFRANRRGPRVRETGSGKAGTRSGGASARRDSPLGDRRLSRCLPGRGLRGSHEVPRHSAALARLRCEPRARTARRARPNAVDRPCRVERHARRRHDRRSAREPGTHRRDRARGRPGPRVARAQSRGRRAHLAFLRGDDGQGSGALRSVRLRNPRQLSAERLLRNAPARRRALAVARHADADPRRGPRRVVWREPARHAAAPDLAQVPRRLGVRRRTRPRPAAADDRPRCVLGRLRVAAPLGAGAGDRVRTRIVRAGRGDRVGVPAPRRWRRRHPALATPRSREHECDRDPAAGTQDREGADPGRRGDRDAGPPRLQRDDPRRRTRCRRYRRRAGGAEVARESLWRVHALRRSTGSRRRLLPLQRSRRHGGGDRPSIDARSDARSHRGVDPECGLRRTRTRELHAARQDLVSPNPRVALRDDPGPDALRAGRDPQDALRAPAA